MKKIYILLIMSAIFLNASENYKIKWQLENPFRFFKQKDDYWQMKKIYDEFKGSENKSFKFERAMQSKKWKNGKFITNGWAAYFAINGYKNTYWDQNTMMYQKDYVNPKFYKILVSLKNIPSKYKCEWWFNSNESTIGVCNKNTPILISDTDINKNITLHYKILNSNKKGSKIVKIRDILIVGLGDSYAAGEGNPDIPVVFHNQRIDRDIFLVKNRYYPRKDYNSSAKWLDRRCHRSLYSYQFKTALQYSLEHPKNFVTFVSFSCTGAKSENILSDYKSASENIKHIKPRFDNKLSASDLLEGKKDNSKDRRKLVRPQIKLLKDTLKGKKADIILLSIGGNDIGFSKYVMNILFKTGAKKPRERTKYEMASILTENYYTLSKVLKNYIKNKDNKRVLLTAYPKVLYDENGHLCQGDRQAFDIPFGITEKRKYRLQDTEKYLTKPLYKIQSRLAHEIGWSLVYKHRKKFKTHGFCAKTLLKYETFVMPHKNKLNQPWIPFAPSQYRPYKQKQRWFQLPVDSLLMINKTKRFLGVDIDLFFSDQTSGVMHPSADGLAVEAGENVRIINEILKR